jgi:gamma-glutamyltranspeptidase/glutathione hydrolase
MHQVVVPRRLRRRAQVVGAAGLSVALALTVTSATSPGAATRTHPSGHAQSHAGTPAATGKQAVARGTGGAVSSVDADASRIGLEVLRAGGTAADAAVATAAALGVTEPYSAGIGGGGYFVYYDARSGKVSTIDGREKAPAGITHDAFIDESTGQPYPFFPDLVTSGVSVGVPGTLATWQKALNRWGNTDLAAALAPAEALARTGFQVDETFHRQTQENAERFSAFPSTSRLYLPGGQPRPVGAIQRNPDLADTYALLAARGTAPFYHGDIAGEIAQTVQFPPATDDTDLPIPAGSMTRKDLARYRVVNHPPTHVRYRNLDVYGMPPSSSGGITVGESLNILDDFKLDPANPVEGLHLYLEATARAFADRAAYIGDPKFVDVPTKRLTSQDFANARACTIDPQHAATKPVAAAPLDASATCGRTPTGRTAVDTEGLSTTHLSVVDRWGNAVSYTLTIEQTGGSGMVVPHRGFLLNNELTDFSAVYDAKDPNRIEPNKRPRSSMSPTIVLQNGKLKYVIGSPGGSTIITTVLQVLLNRTDFGMTLPKAVAAPRASQRNTTDVTAEQSFIKRYKDALAPYGHTFVPAGAPGTSAAEIGAVAAIEVTPGGQLLAVAEPTRRGGGDAEVVLPTG